MQPMPNNKIPRSQTPNVTLSPCNRRPPVSPLRVPASPLTASPCLPVPTSPCLQTTKLLLCTTLLILITITLPATAENTDTIILMAEEIRAMQTMKIGDVLDSVPGVKAGDTSVSIHGSSKVKVFLDGRPLNDPTSSHGAVNWDLVSPENVARIEILRGKGGLAYGQDAAGGVILIYSRQDTRRVNAGVKAYAGNHDTSSISVTFDTTVDQWRGGLSATGLNTQGYKINNDKDRYQLGANVGYDIKEDVSAGLSVDYLYDERGLSGLPEYPTPHSRKESGNTGLALHIDVRRWKSKTHYNEGYNHNTDPSRSLNKTLRVAKFGQTLTTEFRTTDHGDLNCGTAFTWDRAAGTGFEDQQENSGAVFGAQSYTWPSANLTLVAGLRGEYHTVFGGALNPEVKVAYQRSIWRISTAYSHSYNTPSLYQRYNETSSTPAQSRPANGNGRQFQPELVYFAL